MDNCSPPLCRSLADRSVADVLPTHHGARTIPFVGAHPTSSSHVEPACFARAFDAHGAVAYALALRIVGSTDTAEDVLHKTFLAMWKAGALPGRDPSGTRQQILTDVRDRAIEEMRRRPPLHRVTPGFDDTADAFATLGNGDGASVGRALRDLPVELRRPIELAFFGGQSATTIAAAMGVHRDAVRASVWSGLRIVRSALRGVGAPSTAT